MNAKPPRSSGSRNVKATKALQKSSNTGMIVTVVALLVVAALVLAGIVWWAKKDGASTGVVNGLGSADPQVSTTDRGVVSVGKAGAPTVQIWEDFMCPACGQFEQQNGQQLSDAITKGDVRVEYHMMNFLDPQSRTKKYSTRAIAAVQCVAAKEPLKVLLDVKSAMFAKQPQEGSGDLSASELADIARSAGAGDSADCIANVEKNGGMDRAETTAENSLEAVKEVNPRVSTPTVASNGKQVEFSDPNWLKNIIAGKA